MNDEAVRAGARALNDGPLGVQVYEDEVRKILRVAVPLILESLAREFEALRDGPHDAHFDACSLTEASSLALAAAVRWSS